MMRPEADAAIQIAMEVHRITEEKIAEAYQMAEHSRSSTEQLDALRRAL
jgi:hypothetical protein